MYHTVYILNSQTLNKFYIGHTRDLIEGRIRRHLTDHDGFTSRVEDWQPLYQKEFENRVSAAKRERVIKSWKSSIRVKSLIANWRLR